jgi:membrane protease YdiL (CAAX protease family)
MSDTTVHETKVAPATDGLWAFCALACGITWALSAPLGWCFATHTEPAPPFLLMAGLSAFGPTIAAAVVAGRQPGGRRAVFGRWRTAPIGRLVLFVLAGLALSFVLHQVANVLEVALGGAPSRWVYPPERPEHVAALVFFSIGEEFGWRGFANQRFVARYGAVRGSLALGLVWALWHATMIVSPETGQVNLVQVAFLLTQLPLCSVIITWLMRRSGWSMAVAIAAHASAHLDNVTHAPASDARVLALLVTTAAVAAGLAARALQRELPDAAA